ncbi:metal-dependent hydrolase [Candidatus Bathyarchaeota archaeon]|nr:metal-dependent hydrolase [Candidatus Bathyarchaeota archaeon]
MVRVTWFGHAAFKIELTGKIVLVDPWLGNPLSPVKPSDISDADVVYVTHDHSDHLGEAIEICKRTGAVFVATYELGNYAIEKGLKNVMGANIGGSVQVNDLKLRIVQAFHTASKGTPTGVIVEGEGKRIYHAGDTGLFGDMKLIGELYNPDLALIPIGGYYTMDALEATEAVRLIHPKVVIPMHYRTFPVLAQSADEFVEKVRETVADVRVVVLNPGESYEF